MLGKWAIATDAINLLHLPERLLDKNGLLSAAIHANAYFLMLLGLAATFFAGLILALRILRSALHPLGTEEEETHQVFDRRATLATSAPSEK